MTETMLYLIEDALDDDLPVACLHGHDTARMATGQMHFATDSCPCGEKKPRQKTEAKK